MPGTIDHSPTSPTFGARSFDSGSGHIEALRQAAPSVLAASDLPDFMDAVDEFERRWTGLSTEHAVRYLLWMEWRLFDACLRLQGERGRGLLVDPGHEVTSEELLFLIRQFVAHPRFCAGSSRILELLSKSVNRSIRVEAEAGLRSLQIESGTRKPEHPGYKPAEQGIVESVDAMVTSIDYTHPVYGRVSEVFENDETPAGLGVGDRVWLVVRETGKGSFSITPSKSFPVRRAKPIAAPPVERPAPPDDLQDPVAMRDYKRQLAEYVQASWPAEAARATAGLL